MRKVFIDCGFYHGKGLRIFKNKNVYDPEFEIYAFEPLLNPKQKKKYKSVHFIEKAVWIYDGEIEFHTSGRRGGQANGIFKNPRARREKVIKVPCIDFGRWVKETFNKDDYIVLKMDIEGAEQEILEHMVADDSIDYLNMAYVEFHSKTKKGYRELKNELKNKENLILRSAIEWYHRKRKGG